MNRVFFFTCATALVGCSVIAPLGDEYTFEDSDASTPPDMGPSDGGGSDGGQDMGPVCDTIPTEEEACADRCGEVTVCDTVFVCGGCTGELSCGGGGVENVCGCADPPCALTTARVGDVNRQSIVGIAADGDGNVFVAGNFRGTITFGDDSYTNPGATRNDMFLAKLDPEGNALWSRAYGALDDPTGADEQLVSALAVDAAGNVVLVGYSYSPINLGGDDLPSVSDMVVVKLDGDGGHIFSDTYACSSGNSPVDVAIDPASQEIFITGRFYGTLEVGSLSPVTAATPGGYFDIFLIRLNAAGLPQRVKRYGDASDQVSESMAVSSTGNVYLSAIFNGEFDFGPPTTTLSTGTWYSLAVTKINTTFLSHQWSRQYGTEVFASQLVADTTGGIFLSGKFSGTVDIDSPALDAADGDSFLAQLDADGNTVWSKQFTNIRILDLSVGADGTLYAVGQVNGGVDLGDGTVAGSGGLDAFIAHYAADGTHLWSRVFTAPVGDQSGTGVAASPDGTAWMIAELEGQVDFGTGQVTSAGDRDVAIVSFQD